MSISPQRCRLIWIHCPCLSSRRWEQSLLLLSQLGKMENEQRRCIGSRRVFGVSVISSFSVSSPLQFAFLTVISPAYLVDHWDYTFTPTSRIASGSWSNFATGSGESSVWIGPGVTSIEASLSWYWWDVASRSKRGFMYLSAWANDSSGMTTGSGKGEMKNGGVDSRRA